jgi:hypothetical protein
MSAAVAKKKVWTEAELEALPEDGYIHEVVNGELVMSPKNNWQQLWAHYLCIGGSLDPEPDTESPFYDDSAPGPCPADGRPGLRVLRRSRV